LYVKITSCETLVVSIYVDDMVVTESNTELIQKFKGEMQKVFEIKVIELVDSWSARFRCS